MSGKMPTSSGTEDLSSNGVLEALSKSMQSTSARNAILGMFFPAHAGKAEVTAAFESLIPDLPNQNPKAEGEGCGEMPKRPPLASKVIDEDGHAYITIVYDGNPNSGGGDTGMFCGLMDAATANDIVDITIITTLYDFAMPKSNIFSVRPLLSAMKRCKAKIITRVGCLCSVGDCAVWLSGDDRRISPMGWLAVRQPTACCGGTMKDAEFRVEDFKSQFKELTDYVVSTGLITAEEVTRMMEDQAIIACSYDELAERIKNLKEVA